MIAIDTNVIVRIVTLDDEAEAARARQLVTSNPIFVGATVVLETAWVLGSRYKLSQAVVSASLRAFAGLPSVNFEAVEEVHRALIWADEGMDIADALHLSLAASVGPLATFDRQLLRQARDRQTSAIEP